jgi:hypothetical protein
MEITIAFPWPRPRKCCTISFATAQAAVAGDELVLPTQFTLQLCLLLLIQPAASINIVIEVRILQPQFGGTVFVKEWHGGTVSTDC